MQMIENLNRVLRLYDVAAGNRRFRYADGIWCQAPTYDL